MYVGCWCLFASHSGRPWEFFITMPRGSGAPINQMCWPVIIASALSQGLGDFTRELPLIGLWSTSPCVFWKTSEQKAECQFNWCVCGCRCTLLTGRKLVPGCNSRTKGLTHWYVHTAVISYCANSVWRTMSAGGATIQWYPVRTVLMILKCMFLHFNMGPVVQYIQPFTLCNLACG